jgi:hypothetical protein
MHEVGNLLTFIVFKVVICNDNRIECHFISIQGEHILAQTICITVGVIRETFLPVKCITARPNPSFGANERKSYVTGFKFLLILCEPYE